MNDDRHPEIDPFDALLNQSQDDEVASTPEQRTAAFAKITSALEILTPQDTAMLDDLTARACPDLRPDTVRREIPSVSAQRDEATLKNLKRQAHGLRWAILMRALPQTMSNAIRHALTFIAYGAMAILATSPLIILLLAFRDLGLPISLALAGTQLLLTALSGKATMNSKAMHSRVSYLRMLSLLLRTKMPDNEDDHPDLTTPRKIRHKKK